MVGQLVHRHAQHRLRQHHAAETGQRAPPRPAAAGERDPQRGEQPDLEGGQDRPGALLVREAVAGMPGQSLQSLDGPAHQGAEDRGRGERGHGAGAHRQARPRRRPPPVAQTAAMATSRTATRVCEKAWIATPYDPTTAAGTDSTSKRETPRQKKIRGVASSAAARGHRPSGAASVRAMYSGISGVKMHSWVTTKPPWSVRMIAPDTATVVPAAARMPPPGTAIQPAMTSTAGLS